MDPEPRRHMTARAPRGALGPVLVVLVVLVGMGIGAGGAALWSSANNRAQLRDVAATGSSGGREPGSSSTVDVPGDAGDIGGTGGTGGTGGADGADDSPTGSQRGTSATAPAVAPPTQADPRTADDVAAGLLSLGVPTVASGRLVVVPGGDPAPRPGAVRTVRVEVEDGLDVDGALFAGYVMQTLNDPRGWGAGGAFSFARTDDDDADYRVVLASGATVDQLCAPLRTQGEVSCAIDGHATINDERWVMATPEFSGIVRTYRQYVVNHEVGHLLGHGHVTCPGAGLLAPVMQQQTYAAAPCLPNAWPHP